MFFVPPPPLLVVSRPPPPPHKHPHSLKGQEGERLRKNPLGLGLLLGGAVFSYGLSCGCSKAEILAINDDGACGLWLFFWV